LISSAIGLPLRIRAGIIPERAILAYSFGFEKSAGFVGLAAYEIIRFSD
jgi:hypothetical protein